MRQFGNRLLRELADLCFSKSCLGCGLEGLLLCPSCQLKLVWRARQICPVCHRELTVDESCHESLLANLWSLSVYDGLAAKLIKAFKYDGVTDLTEEVFKEALKLAADKIIVPPGKLIIVPVPLHRQKHLRRGFNQSEMLARALSDLLDRPMVTDLLKRKINNKPQARQNFELRIKNVQGIFVVDYRHLSDYWGCRILLIDDVYTTGSTLSECARELKKYGFKDISAITLAFGR
jgi:competence protein ComFC